MTQRQKTGSIYRGVLPTGRTLISRTYLMGGREWVRAEVHEFKVSSRNSSVFCMGGSVEERVKLVTRGTVEVVKVDELRSLFKAEKRPRAYWGFECSGFMHVGMGLVIGNKIIDMVSSGCEFIIFLADWHSWINDKLGGVMENIRLAGQYFKECFSALGIPEGKVKYVWASDIVSDSRYWEILIRIAKSASTRRVIRSLPIMGRKASLSVQSAWLIYPLMQAADIFYMGIQIACAGIDQRKVHMLARDVAKRLGWRPPICVHTPLLPSLAVSREVLMDKEEDFLEFKMSKSKPEGAIWVHDEPEAIERKVLAAYCPKGVVEGNPVLALVEHAIFPRLRKPFVVERELKYGGDVSFASFEELAKEYETGNIHPLDLKRSVAKYLAEILKPVRDHFSKHPATLEELIKIETLLAR